MIKVRGFLMGVCGMALTLNEALAASPPVRDDGVAQGYALPIGLGVLLLAATVFRRRRGRS